MLSENQYTRKAKDESFSEVTLKKTTLALMPYFTEQGSFVSQMTAAKVVDGTARLLVCAGHAADAVSA